MKIVGVVTEYNPLHYGHQYQLYKIREHSQCDVLVVLMSGNLVQRGQFAVADKWTRAKMALRSGADVVFELPLLASMQSADYFAKISIQLLAKLGCSAFYFGTEEADVATLLNFVSHTTAQEKHLDELISVHLKQGHAYAAAYQLALDELGINFSFDTSSPNHILGIHYLKTNQALNKPMGAYAIKRLRQHPNFLLSATSIRQKSMEDNNFKNWVPNITYELLKNQAMIKMEDYWLLLKYQLMTHDSASLAMIEGVREGIEHLILSKVKKVNSWEQLVNQLTSKRWTRASINRILIAILGNLTKKQWDDYQRLFIQQPTIRLLGYHLNVSTYLKFLRKQDVQIITNWKKEFNTIYQLQWRMDEIFAMNSFVKIDDQNLARIPIQIKIV